MPRSSINRVNSGDFEPRKKNPLGLLDDANLDAHLKSLKIGDKLAPILISDDEVRFNADFSLDGKFKMHRIETDNQYLHLIAREGEANGYIVNQAAYVRQTDSSGLYPYDVYNVSAALYKIGHTQVLEYASTGNYQFHGGTTSFIEMKYADNSFNIYNKDDSGDYFKILCDTAGATTISTVDDGGATAHLTLDADGDIILEAAGGNVTSDAPLAITSTTADQFKVLYDGSNYGLINVAADGHVEIESVGTDADITLNSASAIELNSDGGYTAFFDGAAEIGRISNSINSGTLTLRSLLDANDQLILTCGTNGVSSIATSASPDDNTAHLTLNPDGSLKINPSDGFLIKEVADAAADLAGYGQVWIHDTTPNELCFTDDAGTDIIGIGKYHYETKFIAFYATSAAVYFPMNGYIIEGTSSSGRNEHQSFLAPYNGTIEKIAFRTEIAQDGPCSIRVLESADDTEIPGSVVFRKDETIDIADDTYHEYPLTSPSVGSDYCPLTKGRIYMIYMSFVSTPYDTNVNMVFKWDITS